MASDFEGDILKLVMNDDSLSVSDIAKKINTSTVTVRSCLASLEEKGFILRNKGGAVPSFHPDILERLRQMSDEKRAIAKTAAGLVKDGDTIMIEAGTTTSLIAKYLRGKRDIHVVTNSTLLIPYARTNPSLHLTVTGGVFSPKTESLIGPITLRELELFHVSIAFIGTDGFTRDQGLTTHLVEGAEVVKRMAQQCAKVVLLADSSKFGKTGFAKVLPLAEIDTIITDKDISEEMAQVLRDADVEIITTQGDQDGN